MRGLIFGNFIFPYGTAPSSRVSNLALGAKNNGFPIWIIVVFRSSEVELHSKVVRFEGNIIIYLNRYINLNNYGFLRPIASLLIMMSSSIKYIVLLSKKRRYNKLKFSIIYGRNASLLWLPVIYNKIFKIKIFLDVVEIKFQFKYRKWSIHFLDQFIGMPLLLYMSDKCFIISKEIGKALGKNISQKCYLVPGIKSWSKMNIQLFQITSLKYIKITYVGNLIERDNPKSILNFIEGILLNDISIDIELLLVGKISDQNVKKYFSESRLMNLGRFRYHVCGKLPENEYQNLGSNTDFFILPRSESEEGRCAFPTRILDMIEWKKPIILSPTGDLKDYFFHGINCIYLNEDLKSNIVFKNAISSSQVYTNLVKNAYDLGSINFNCNTILKNIIDEI